MAQMPDPEIASTRIYGTLIRSRAESRQAGLGTRRARRRTRRVLGNGAVPTRCLGHPPWIIPHSAGVCQCELLWTTGTHAERLCDAAIAPPAGRCSCIMYV
jgi:hypothetical protein